MRSPFRLLFLMIAVAIGALAGPATAGAYVSTGGPGWHWLYPQPAGSGANDAAFVDALTGWTVGMGSVLKTADGGLTWTSQKLPVPLYCQSVDFIDPLHGWVLGNSRNGSRRIILRTTDGGRHWAVVYNGTYEIQDMDFATAKVGLIGGVDGTMRRTTDGGVTWKRAVLPAGLGPYQVHMATSTAGFALAQPLADGVSTILRTADGGRTWTVAYAAGGWYSDIAVVDALTAFVACERWDDLGDSRQVILRTTDGGGTWVELPPPKPDVAPGENAQIQAVAAAGPDHVWVWWTDYGDPMLSFTSTGGADWSTRAWTWIWNAGCIDETHVWEVTGDQTRLSDDGGATWRSAWDATPPLGGFIAMDFVSNAEGWAVGDPSSAVHTTDGGATWQVEPLPNGSRGWRDVDFCDALNGWAVGTGWSGEGKLIAHTADGGLTWVEQTNAPFGYDLNAICAVDPLTAYAVGGGLYIIKTTDGGVTWTALTFPVYGSTELQEVDFSSPLAGLVTTGGGELYKTADGGASWTEVGLGVADAIMAVDRSPDGRRIWMAGVGSTLISSADGGVTLRKRSTGAVTAHWYAVTFSDARNGWLGGRSNGETVVLRTTDGGNSWRLQSLGMGADCTDLQAFSATHVFAAGGGIFETTSGGVPPSGDRTPPTLTAHKPKGLWHNHRVRVSFSGSDPSGMRYVFARADKKSCDLWATTVAPANDESMEGMHTIRGTGMDMAGNGSGTIATKVGIDSSLPTTIAENDARVVAGGSAGLGFAVADYKPGCGAARCTLKIATTTGKVVRSVSLGLRKTNRWYAYSYRASLPAGKYRWYIYARDIAGNPPYVMYYSILTVGGGGGAPIADGPVAKGLRPAGTAQGLDVGYQPRP